VKREAEEDWTLIKQNPRRSLRRFLLSLQSWSAVCLPILRIVPVVDILFDLIFGEAVTLLDFAFKLISFAVDCGKVIVGEISPFLFDLAPTCQAFLEAFF